MGLSSLSLVRQVTAQIQGKHSLENTSTEPVEKSADAVIELERVKKEHEAQVRISQLEAEAQEIELMAGGLDELQGATEEVNELKEAVESRLEMGGLTRGEAQFAFMSLNRISDRVGLECAVASVESFSGSVQDRIDLTHGVVASLEGFVDSAKKAWNATIGKIIAWIKSFFSKESDKDKKEETSSKIKSKKEELSKSKSDKFILPNQIKSNPNKIGEHIKNSGFIVDFLETDLERILTQIKTYSENKKHHFGFHDTIAGTALTKVVELGEETKTGQHETQTAVFLGNKKFEITLNNGVVSGSIIDADEGATDNEIVVDKKTAESVLEFAERVNELRDKLNGYTKTYEDLSKKITEHMADEEVTEEDLKVTMSVAKFYMARPVLVYLVNLFKIAELVDGIKEKEDKK